MKRWQGQLIIHKQTHHRVHSQWRFRENIFGLQRKNQLCPAALGKTAWEPEVFIRKCQKFIRPSQQVDHGKFSLPPALIRLDMERRAYLRSFGKNWNVQTITAWIIKDILKSYKMSLRNGFGLSSHGYSMPQCKVTNFTTHFGFKPGVQCNVAWSSSYLFIVVALPEGMNCNYAKTWIQNAIAIFQICCMLWT